MKKQTDPASPWLNRKQLAKHLNLSQRKTDYLVADGEIPFVAFGRSKRFHREMIDKLLLGKMVRE